MKKIYTFLFACLLLCGTVSTSFGQSLKIIDAVTGAVINDSVISVSGLPNATIQVAPYIVNTGVAAINMRVEKIDINMVSGADHAFCVSLFCYPPSVYVSTSSITDAARRYPQIFLCSI